MSKHLKTCKKRKKEEEKNQKAKENKCERLEDEYQEYDESKIYKGGKQVQKVMDDYLKMMRVSKLTKDSYMGSLKNHIIPYLEANNL